MLPNWEKESGNVRYFQHSVGLNSHDWSISFNSRGLQYL